MPRGTKTFTVLSTDRLEVAASVAADEGDDVLDPMDEVELRSNPLGCSTPTTRHSSTSPARQATTSWKVATISPRSCAAEAVLS